MTKRLVDLQKTAAVISQKDIDFPRTKTDTDPLPPEWEVKHSKSRGGRIYYYNSVTGVSTWIKPHSATGDQDKCTPEEKGATWKDKMKHSSEMKQSALSLIALNYKQQKDKDPLAPSGYSQKRKAENGAIFGFSPTKIMKSRNITVNKMSIPEYQKISRNKTQTECRKKLVVKHDIVKKHILDTSNSTNTKYKEHLLDKKSSKRSFTSSKISTVWPANKDIQNSVTAAKAPVGSLKKLAKASRRKQKNKASSDGSKNVSDISDSVSEVMVKSHEENYPSENKKMRLNKDVTICKIVLGADVIKSRDQHSSESVQTDGPSFENKQRRQMNSSQRINTHQSFIDVKNIEKNDKMEPSSYESLLHSQSSHCQKYSSYSKESSHQGNSPFSNKTSTSLASQTNSGHAVYSQNSENSSLENKNNSPLVLDESNVYIRLGNINKSANSGTPSSLSDLNMWSASPVNDNWKTCNISSSKDSFNSEDGSNLSFNSGPQSSLNSTEVETDIEDMEVDEEGLVILSNLQDVRIQTSSVPDEPRGVLTETVARVKRSSLSNTTDSRCETSKSEIILIVDTNVLISCLRFLRDILSYKIPGYGGIILVLPWIVMQELDYLKNGKNSINNLSVSTSQRAAKAVRFIHSHLVNRNPRLIGQTPLETREDSELSVQCNDDRILQCCRQFEKKYASSKVVLLTRDMNLINKAMIMGINAASNETLWSRLKIPKPHFCNRRMSSDERNSLTDTSDARIIPLKSTDFITSSHPELHAITTENETIRASPTALFRASSPTPLRASSVIEDLNLPEKTLPVKDDYSASLKVTVVQERVPQNETEKAVIMNKFEAVWKLIYDIKSQISAVLADGKSHINYSEAVKMLQVIIPLLSVLKENFSRCLSMSPVILWEHEAEFNALCTNLNTFFVQAETLCADPSQPVETSQLIKHFCESGNRPILLAGLEQLCAFLTDMEGMIKMCS